MAQVYSSQNFLVLGKDFLAYRYLLSLELPLFFGPLCFLGPDLGVWKGQQLLGVLAVPSP